MNKRFILLVGAFGGVLPTLGKLAMELQAGRPFPDPTYWVGLTIWALCGAVVAIVWGETDLKKVLYLGVGLPSLIQFNVANLQGLPKTAPVADESASYAPRFEWISSAYAQQTGDCSGRTIRLVLSNTSPLDRGYRVLFYAADSSFLSKVAVSSGQQAVSVPPSATSFAVQYHGAHSGTIRLGSKPGAQLQLHVDVKRKSWSGFLRAIGAQPTTEYVVVANVR